MGHNAAEKLASESKHAARCQLRGRYRHNNGQISGLAGDGYDANDPGCVKTRSVCLWAA
jgi:hypothetical protein